MKLRNVLLWAFFLRLIWLFCVAATGGQAWTQDSVGYAALAENLLSEAAFTQGGEPETYRTPGYPLFVMLASLLGHLTWATLFLQVLLSTATVYGVYLLSRQILNNEKAALLAALLFAFEPLSIFYCSLLLTETLFECCLIFFLERFYAGAKGQDVKAIVVASLCLTAAIFVRPIAFYIPRIFLLVFLLMYLKPHFFDWKPWPIQKIVTAAILFSLVTFGSTSLWIQRNKEVANMNRFYMLNKMFLDYQAAATISKVKNQSVKQSRLEIEERYATEENVGPKILAEYPFVFLGIYVKGWFKNLLDPGTVDAAKQLDQYPEVGGLANKMIEEGIVSVLMFLMKERPVLFFFTLVLGLWLLVYYFYAFKGLRREFKLLLPLLLLFVYFLALSGGSNALARYRFPLMAFLCIFAGLGLSKEDAIEE